MKALKILIWILGILAFFILVVPLLLPKTYTVERSAEINAPIETAYIIAADFDYRTKWDPWLSMDPDAEVCIIGESKTIGSGYTWDGEVIGSGKMTIKELEENKKIISDLEFFNPRPGKANVLWTFSEKNEKTLAYWSINGSLAYPVERLMGLFMDKILGPDLEKGIESFKGLCEETGIIPQARTGEIGEKEMPGRGVLTMLRETNLSEIGLVLGECYGQLMAYAGKNNASVTGAPFAIYLTYNRETGDVKLMPGIPVAKKLPSKGEIKYQEFDPTRVVYASHFGTYPTISVTYDAIGEYLKKNKIEPAGNPWEEYVTDPGSVESEYLIETLVYFPVK